MRYVGWASQDLPFEERVWRMGLYMSVYNYASAEQLWSHLELADCVRYSPLPWLTEHWGGLELRRERRAVRTPKKLAVSIMSYAQWTAETLPRLMEELRFSPQENYSILWDQAQQDLRYFGRYAIFKLLETYRRYCGLNIEMFDIRPSGGYSPRTTLSLLYEGKLPDPKDNRAAGLHLINQAAQQVREELSNRLGSEVDWYRFEVFLCDYLQSYEGRRQYPGRSNDSEIHYYNAIAPYWKSVDPLGANTKLWEARAVLHPTDCLGEICGWDGPRKNLGAFLRDNDTTWSDLLYVYQENGELIERNNKPQALGRLRSLARKTLVEG